MAAAWEPFCELLHVESRDGRGAARSRLAGLREAYLAARAVGGEVPLAETAGEDAWPLARTRGVWVLWMLRDAVGPTAFQAACGDWLAGCEPPSLAALRAHAEAEHGAELGAFLDYWTATTGLPDYRLRSAVARRCGDGYLVTLQVENRGQGPILVAALIRTEEGAQHEFAIRAGTGERTEARYPVLTRPVAAALDPEGDLLSASGAGSWVSVRVRLWGLF
ncbi:MAG: hypothetical protein HY320_09205 [Armatimonadetes bacterium]|nr:hypothetical protein [Armatimonadota bacterium]